MSQKASFVRYENINEESLPSIITELRQYRYFTISALYCELTFSNESEALRHSISIYLSSFSALSPPIYILLPQLFKTLYSPCSSDLVFGPSFLNSETLKLVVPISNDFCDFIPEITEKFSKACMGGTFDHMHPGHLIFLTVAAYLSNFLGIGVTHPAMLSKKKQSQFIQSFDFRVNTVRKFLKTLKQDLEIDLFEINDPVGKAGYEDYDAVILTSEVEKAFDLINQVRVKNGVKTLEKFVLFRFGEVKISSSIIRNEIYEKNQGIYDFVQEKWVSLCERNGVNEAITEKWWEFIASQYSREVRFYHTLKHLYNCYQNLSSPNDFIEFAIFFHDIIYFPMKHPDLLTNEELSAEVFKEFFEETKISNEFLRVIDYILATIKHRPIRNCEEELEFLDIDLSILASDWEDYLEYCFNIRKEYSWYSDKDFFEGRKNVMNGFLRRENIFFSEKFRQRENKARENILKEINEVLVLSEGNLKL